MEKLAKSFAVTMSIFALCLWVSYGIPILLPVKTSTPVSNQSQLLTTKKYLYIESKGEKQTINARYDCKAHKKGEYIDVICNLPKGEWKISGGNARTSNPYCYLNKHLNIIQKSGKTIAVGHFKANGCND